MSHPLLNDPKECTHDHKEIAYAYYTQHIKHVYIVCLGCGETHRLFKEE
jgi:hypothetical protein